MKLKRRGGRFVENGKRLDRGRRRNNEMETWLQRKAEIGDQPKENGDKIQKKGRESKEEGRESEGKKKRGRKQKQNGNMKLM